MGIKEVKLITEIGCSDDGGVWIKLMIEVGGEKQIGVLPMTQEIAIKVRDSLSESIRQGQVWKETGKNPNPENQIKVKNGNAPILEKHNGGELPGRLANTG